MSETGIWSGRPVYWNRETNLFLYFLQLRIGGLWTLGPHVGKLGLLGHLDHQECPQNLMPGSWKYRVESTWFLDQNIPMKCMEKPQVKL